MTWTFPCNKLFDNEEGVGKMDLVPIGAGGAGGVSARPRSAVDGGGRSGRGGVGGGAARPGSAYFGGLEGAGTAFYEGSRPGSRRLHQPGVSDRACRIECGRRGRMPRPLAGSNLVDSTARRARWEQWLCRAAGPGGLRMLPQAPAPAPAPAQLSAQASRPSCRGDLGSSSRRRSFCGG